jgi:uncharacterized coiled-coil DUF342 family protein
MALAERRITPNLEQILKGTPARKGNLEHIRNEYLMREIASLNKEFTSPQLSVSEQRAILERLNELRKAINQKISPIEPESEEPF